MTLYVLVAIEERFQVRGRGLVIAPDLSVRQGLAVDEGERPAALRLPAGEELSCSVTLGLAHFNIPSSTDLDRRWRYVPMIRGLTEDDVLPGSLLLVTDERWVRIFALTPAQPLARN